MEHIIYTDLLKLINALGGTISISSPTNGNIILNIPVKSGTIGLAEDIINKADLGGDGRILYSQLPGSYSQVLYGTFHTPDFWDMDDNPYTPAVDKLYADVNDNKIYMWGGSSYVNTDTTLALGETAATAYRGDRGKVAFEHAVLTNSNPHGVTKSMLGLANVDNTSDANKPISTAVTNALLNKSNKIVLINNQSASYDFALSDFEQEKLVVFNNSTSGVAQILKDVFPVGATLKVCRIGDGSLTFAAATGVTLKSADDAYSLRTKNSICEALQIANNVWILAGDLKV